MPFNKYHTPEVMDLLAKMLSRYCVDVREQRADEICNWMVCTTFEPMQRMTEHLKNCLMAMKSLGPGCCHESYMDFRVLLFCPEGLFECTGNGRLWDENTESEVADSNAFEEEWVREPATSEDD